MKITFLQSDENLIMDFFVLNNKSKNPFSIFVLLELWAASDVMEYEILCLPFEKDTKHFITRFWAME